MGRRILAGAVTFAVGVGLVLIGVTVFGSAHPARALLVEGVGGIVALAGLVVFTIATNRRGVQHLAERLEAELHELDEDPPAH